MRHLLRGLVVVAVILGTCLNLLPVAQAQPVPGWHQVKRFDDAVAVAALSQFDGSSLVVATRTRGVFYSVGGQEFKPGSAFMSDFDVTTIAYVSPHAIWVGTSGDGLWSSTDSGATWSRVVTLQCTSVASIYPDPASPGTTYVATLCSGVFISKDLGVTFKNVSLGVSSVHATGIVRIDAGTLAISTVDDNVHISRDNGRSFVLAKSPLASVDWVVYDPSHKSVMVAGGSSIAVSADLGKTWKLRPLPGGLPVRGLVVRGSTVIAATAGGGVYGSRDAGVTWYPMNQGLEDRAMASLTASGMSVIVASDNGEVSRLSSLVPYLVVVPTDVDLGRIPQNRRMSFVVRLENIGGDTLEAVAESLPGYITSDRVSATTTYKSSVTLTVDPSDLTQRTYELVIRVTSNGGDVYVNLRFEVVPAAPVHLVMTIGKTSALLDGQTRTIEAAPFIDKVSGRTLVPVRFIAEALGAVVGWDAGEQRVSLATPGGSGALPSLIDLYIGRRSAEVNGRTFTIDVVPVIRAGRTFVPARFVSESLGARVTWNSAKRQVTIDYVP